ncbi:MAG: glycosyltransferase [Bacteroidetes bacterium]|nr:glycosyltransferase [Bacteroidota bacterium]
MTNTQDEINRLKAEIKKTEKELEWYNDTYKNRKLIGIIKDRILIRFKFIEKLILLLKNNPYLFKSKSPSILSEKIVCVIVNHNNNENAIKLRNNFSRYFDTIIIDSGSEIKDKTFICLENVYYSGLLNNAYNYAKTNKYDFLLSICSDVICENSEIDKMALTLKKLDLTKIGVYSPSSSGRSHAYCKQGNNSGLRSVPFVEGFMFLADMNILEKIFPVDLDINLYGWGLDVAKGYFCRKNNKLCLIDDSVNVYHPGDIGYSTELAEVDMWKWINSFEDESFKTFYSNHIDIIRKGQAGLNKVSVIIPCYNQALYLKETIFNVLLQEHGNIEIIIVDDGSTDNTKEIALEYTSVFSNIKYFYKENGGLGDTRNKGLKNSTGDFIQFLDSDDLLSSNKIFSQIYDFVEDRNVDISYSEYLCFEDGNKDKTWKYSRLILNNDPVLDFIKNWETELSIPVHCFLFKKSTIENLYFDTELPNHEDWDFHLKVASLSPKYKYQPNGIAYYRVRPTSMARDKELMIKGKKMCIKKAIDSNMFFGNYMDELKKRYAEN